MALEEGNPAPALEMRDASSDQPAHAPEAPASTKSHDDASSDLAAEKKRKRGGDGNDVQEQQESENRDANSQRSNKRSKKGGFGKKRPDTNDSKKNLGRREYFRSGVDKRERNEKEQAKQQAAGGANADASKPSVLPKPFTEEEIAQDERKPKRKVAVYIGYSGSGYKGMQISTTEKTIEGDLFTAFVKAGAISKANASDPKKSSLVRCARTDKGVHAAGNIISLKLIVEDPDIVQKINEHLSPQIRVWGIQRTIGSFSCYQQCDSRWYEYLLPTHSLIPPHPSTYLGRKLVELSEQAGDKDGYLARQADIEGFWDKIDESEIHDQLETYDAPLRSLLKKALYEAEAAAPDSGTVNLTGNKDEAPSTEESKEKQNSVATESLDLEGLDVDKKTLETALKSLRNIYLSSKKSYRISKFRLDRLREILDAYVGTHRFHNYTVRMTYRDPSCKRHIKSFAVSEPFERNGTEWVSIKVHGQSFMMHQIRKMIGMAANMVRCGTETKRISESFEDVNIAIPKAPGLGLLLERPVFDSYNKKVEEKFPEKEKIDFTRWEKDMEEFKQREIYDRIFREEEATNQFHGYFINIDTMKDNIFLYFTSMGMEASKRVKGAKGSEKPKIEDSEDEGVGGGEG